MNENSSSGLGEIIFGVAFSSVGMFMILYSRTFPKARSAGVMTGPSFFPTIIGIMMLMLGIYKVIFNFRFSRRVSEKMQRDMVSFYKSSKFHNFLIFILSIALYPTIINYLGFLIGSFLFCLVLMRRLRVKWIASIVSSIVIVFISWVIFEKIAFIGLPTGIIFTE